MIIALDISTNTGYAVFYDKKLEMFGTLPAKNEEYKNVKYPYNFVVRAEAVADAIFDGMNAAASALTTKHGEVFRDKGSVKVVIEETNGSKSRYTQKLLEYIHMAVLLKIRSTQGICEVVYVNTSDWRRQVGVQLDAAQKKANAKLSKAKAAAKKSGVKLDKKKLGIKGRITKKHVAVTTANTLYGLKLKVKDNDTADAICLGSAYIRGVEICNGK